MSCEVKLVQAQRLATNTSATWMALLSQPSRASPQTQSQVKRSLTQASSSLAKKVTLLVTDRLGQKAVALWPSVNYSSLSQVSENYFFLQDRRFLSAFAEFNAFVVDKAAENEISPDLLGARIIGRWKSGAPVDLASTADDPVLAVDPSRNNNFDFSHPDSYVCIVIRPSARLNHQLKSSITAIFALTSQGAPSQRTSAKRLLGRTLNLRIR